LIAAWTTPNCSRACGAATFEAAYERHRARLYSFLARLSRDAEIARDLLQETWLRLARHAARLEPDTQLAAWLFTVARNLHASRRRWALVDEGALAVIRIRRATDETPFDLASAGETERRLEAAIGALPERDREVLLLVAVERFEPAEAARILGIAPAALRQRLHRARERVAARMGEPAAAQGGQR
jgi:RNA polymerase sigma-70 factor (ECF subfamily)